MWCSECQRGQTPLDNGKCPDCGTGLFDPVPEVKEPGTLKLNIELGGGYTDEPIPIMENPVVKKRVVTEETKQKIRDAIKRKKQKKTSG